MAREYTLQRRGKPSRINYEAELNPQQCAAVKAPPGPALVIAGAGSGKTRTLTYRVAYLLENGIPAHNILLLTFTNKAAREMLERVRTLLPEDTSGLWGGTFHSIGNRILRKNAEAAGFRTGFSIMDREDQQDMLDSILGTSQIDTRKNRFPKGEVLADIFSFAINTGAEIGDVLMEKYSYFLELEPQIRKLQALYEERKTSANVLDFDDLLVRPLRLLQENAQIAEYYRRTFQFILVDEYQDTNTLQAKFIDALAAEHRNVMVVGDDAQSIYSWRGANFRNILEFPKHYPAARVYKIETNYRSVPQILQVANAAIAGNEAQYPKELQPARPEASIKPGLVALLDPNQQARFIAQRILELNEEGTEFKEIAVLYRSHFHSMELQMELTHHGIPFQITSGLRFFEQAHIKDVASFLKFVINPRDEVAFKRMVRLLPGIGARTAEQLWSQVEQCLNATPLPVADGDQPGRIAFDFAALLLGQKVPAKATKAWKQLAYTLDEISPKGEPVLPGEMIRSVVEAVYDDYMKSKFANYDQRKDDLTVLANYARQYKETAEFLDQLALVSSLEQEGELRANEENDAITLSSVHQAKGLEWNVVFVIWLTDGMFPNYRSFETPEGVEEERRLFYVAVTRAKDELYLTYPLTRPNSGYAEVMQQPSRFLGEVPVELLEEWRVNAW